jgi:hypothetical protein
MLTVDLLPGRAFARPGLSLALYRIDGDDITGAQDCEFGPFRIGDLVWDVDGQTFFVAEDTRCRLNRPVEFLHTSSM